MENNKLAVYGILKRGFVLDLSHNGCKFLGEGIIPNTVLYSMGGGVGLRFRDLGKNPLEVENYPKSTFDFVQKVRVQPAHVEVFEIPDRLWAWLDDIESNGFSYTRKIVPVAIFGHDGMGAHVEEIVDAWVYEHTFPNIRYNRPIVSGVYKE